MSYQTGGHPPKKLHPARLRPAPLHHIEVQPHSLPPRWIVPHWQCDLPASDVGTARLEGVRAVHRQIGAPPWRPLQAISLEYTSAEPLIEEPAQAEMFRPTLPARWAA
jgi:hypothetical protein